MFLPFMNRETMARREKNSMPAATMALVIAVVRVPPTSPLTARRRNFLARNQLNVVDIDIQVSPDRPSRRFGFALSSRWPMAIPPCRITHDVFHCHVLDHNKINSCRQPWRLSTKFFALV
jgi:hypothetical protein